MHWRQEFRRSTQAVVAACAVLFSNFAASQDWQFTYDAAGNLVQQATGVAGPPEIIGQPQTQIVIPGRAASFSVVASGAFNLTYQWLFNGVALLQATNESLLLSNVNGDREGSYTVQVHSSSGTVLSAPAMLMIDSDRDGLGDSWEIAHFGNLAQNPLGDWDADGVSNQVEFRDETDPADSSSAAFGLTLLTDGGQVTITPNRLRFHKGESVTLTATAFAPHSFHAWAGDIDSTNNPVTVVITNQTTIVGYLSSYDIRWRAVGLHGSWNNRSNWNPRFIPASNDNVSIVDTAQVTNNSDVVCRGLTLGGRSSAPSLFGTGNLTVREQFLWMSGNLNTRGRTIIERDATLSAASAGAGVRLYINNGVLENRGTVLWTSGSFMLGSATITNCAGAQFIASQSFAISASGNEARFHNAGAFRKRGQSTTTTLDSNVSFNNYGALEIQDGTVAFRGNVVNESVIEIQQLGTLNVTGGAFASTPGSRIEGDGGFRISNGTATLGGIINPRGPHWFSGGTAHLNGDYHCSDHPATITGGIVNVNSTSSVPVVNLFGGTLAGSGALTILNQMTWTNGTMGGSGRTIIAPGARLDIRNPRAVYLTTRTLENGGSTYWTGANVQFTGGVFTNRPTAHFFAQTASALGFSAGSCRFDNQGTFTKSGDVATTTVAIPFNNYNLVDVQGGLLVMNRGYASGANAVLECAIGGTTFGTEYGRLQTPGPVTLDGSLRVRFINGFFPGPQDSFEVVRAAPRSGEFDNFYFPSNLVNLRLNYAANAVVVNVDKLVFSQPLLLRPVIADSSVLISWLGDSNKTFVLESTTQLGSANWTPVAGPLTLSNNTATQLEALTPSNRFYRVRVSD